MPLLTDLQPALYPHSTSLDRVDIVLDGNRHQAHIRLIVAMGDGVTRTLTHASEKFALKHEVVIHADAYLLAIATLQMGAVYANDLPDGGDTYVSGPRVEVCHA